MKDSPNQIHQPFDEAVSTLCNSLLPKFSVSSVCLIAAWCSWPGEEPEKDRIHLFILSFSKYVLRPTMCTWHICREIAVNKTKSLSYCSWGRGRGGWKVVSKSYNVLVVILGLHGEGEGYPFRWSCLLRRWHEYRPERRGAESCRCLESKRKPESGMGWSVPEPGRGQCGWRRLGEGSIIGVHCGGPRGGVELCSMRLKL